MKKTIGIWTFFVSLLVLTAPVLGDFRVVATYPYIGDVAKRIGGDKVKVDVLAPGNWDPHFLLPKPSYIARVRRADLLIMNGAQLEIGWLPPIVREAANAEIQPGRKGLLDLSSVVVKIQVPRSVSREHGDVHPEGNPHYYLDPGNILRIADAVAERMALLDPGRGDWYRDNCSNFKAEWRKRTALWTKRLAPLKGCHVIQYHRLYDYFMKRFGIQVVGEIEPLPGIPPSSRHLEGLIGLIRKQKVKYIFQDVYHSPRPAEFLSEKTGVKIIQLPHDVGAVREARDIISLYEEIIRRLGQ